MFLLACSSRPAHLADAHQCALSHRLRIIAFDVTSPLQISIIKRSVWHTYVLWALTTHSHKPRAFLASGSVAMILWAKLLFAEHCISRQSVNCYISLTVLYSNNQSGIGRSGIIIDSDVYIS